MNSMVEFEAPSWNQIYRMLLKLAEKIRKTRFKPDVIVGVSRGGWPPARIMSDLLGTTELASIETEFYVGVCETKKKPTLTQPVSTEIKGKKVLVVDEVLDSGKSLRLIKRNIAGLDPKEVKMAVIYYKPCSIIKPDYYVEETCLWVIFPWEIRETIEKIIGKCKDLDCLREETAKLVKAGVPSGLVKKFLKEITEEKKC